LRSGADGLLQFIRLSLETYSNNSAAFLLDTHHLVTSHVTRFDQQNESQRSDTLLDEIIRLDKHYHAMTLNHVAQRASKAQGIALLTLYTKSFSEQPGTSPTNPSLNGPECSRIIQQIKATIRREELHGHLPICWAAFTACLGISAMRSLQVHLFLQVRAIISSAIRLNIVGPYLAHRLLAFNAKQIIDENLVVVGRSMTGIGKQVIEKEDSLLLTKEDKDVVDDDDDDDDDEEGGWKWTWDEDIPDNDTHTPRMTWPLGDLVQARHDQLHSRLFNS
jgi:urease accessory protein